MLVFGWKIVFGRAILSRNECIVQCVAQTCLEKGRAGKNKSMASAREKKRRKEIKRVEDIQFVLQQGRSQEKRHVSYSCRSAEGGLQLLEKRGLCVGNGV